MIAYGSSRLRASRRPRHPADAQGVETDYLAAAGAPVHAGGPRVRRVATTASTSSTRTATGRCTTSCGSSCGRDTPRAALDPPLRRLPARRRNGGRGDRSRGEEAVMSSVAEPEGASDQPHRPDRQGIRRAEVHALRRLRPRRHHRARSRRRSTTWASSRTRSPRCPGIGCSSKTTAYFADRGPRLQRRARPHAGRRDGRGARQPHAALRSASRATATRPRSAPASSCTCSAATSR